MAARKGRKRRPASGNNLIVWARLPKGVSLDAKGPRSPQLEKILRNARLNPEARCFGGDTCIV